MNRKYTAWKKSRTYGDIYGGRERIRLTDAIFAHTHSLKRPDPGQDLPVLLQDNPSKGFFFPISAHEAQVALQSLPGDEYAGITHIWLRRIRHVSRQKDALPLAEFVCGSGVRAIILYPWRRDLRQVFGSKKPSSRAVAEYRRFGSSELTCVRGIWTLTWRLAALRAFSIHLLYHEVGHHVTRYMRHYDASHRKTENAADQYAYQRTAVASYVFDRLQEHTGE